MIITNNPKVKGELMNLEQVEFFPQADQREILRLARDRIHLGAKLIAQPMVGRLKPHEMPYCSVFLDEGQDSLDENSLMAIENSIAETDKFLEKSYPAKYDEQTLPDLQFINLLLLKTIVKSYRKVR